MQNLLTFYINRYIITDAKGIKGFYENGVVSYVGDFFE